MSTKRVLMNGEFYQYSSKPVPTNGAGFTPQQLDMLKALEAAGALKRGMYKKMQDGIPVQQPPKQAPAGATKKSIGDSDVPELGTNSKNSASVTLNAAPTATNPDLAQA